LTILPETRAKCKPFFKISVIFFQSFAARVAQPAKR
jgi:hypothetical protein